MHIDYTTETHLLKRGHAFEDRPEVIYGKIWSQEIKRENLIKLYLLTFKLLHFNGALLNNAET